MTQENELTTEVTTEQTLVQLAYQYVRLFDALDAVCSTAISAGDMAVKQLAEQVLKAG